MSINILTWSLQIKTFKIAIKTLKYINKSKTMFIHLKGYYKIQQISQEYIGTYLPSQFSWPVKLEGTRHTGCKIAIL